MIDIIIPTYNGSSRIGKLLTSIAQQSCQDYHCVLVDDYSTDDSVKYVQNQFPWVEIIQTPYNQGPSHARNIGIAAGDHPYVAFFDDDAYLDDPDWLINAVHFFENNSNVGQIAAMIINADNSEMLLDCGIYQNAYQFGGMFHKLQRNQVNGLHKKSRLVLGACSAGTVIRRSVLEEIGGFDARYFYPVEEI